MGCTSTKSEILAEEQAIQEGQLYLLYSYMHCKDVDHIYRKYSYSGRINTSQFIEISKKLNLASVNMANDPKLQKFYDSFKTQEDYNLNQLLILGILTSQGSAIDKAKLLFEIQDKTSAK